MKVPTVRRFIPHGLALFWAFGITNAFSTNVETLRIVTYNIEADINGATKPLPGLVTPSSGSTNVLAGGVLEGIGEEAVGNDPAQPIDIIALEETTSNPVTVQPIVNGLNAYYGTPNRYALSTYQATESGNSPTTGNGPNAIVYNTATVQLVASQPIDPPGSRLGSSSGEYREVMRYEFAPAGVTPGPVNEFYIYVSHYKSGTTAADLIARGEEAVIIRNDAAMYLPTNSRVIYVGDYNVTTAGEASYRTLLAKNAPNGIVQGQAFDASNTAGATNINWGINSLLNLKTESATNLRYRDDFQLMTSNIFFGTPGGITLVPGTYHVFGNNGSTPYLGSVGSGDTALDTSIPTNAHLSAGTLYEDLTTASDHLPVVADYTLPVVEPLPVAGFGFSPEVGAAPLYVTFYAFSLEFATNWYWDFGDGSSTNTANGLASHIYTNSGAYTITEIVSGRGGSAQQTSTVELDILTPFQEWQLIFFGCFDCSLAQANADADGTGQNNYFKYFTGLNPTDPTSIFTFQVSPATNAGTAMNITFSPVALGRTYQPQFTTDLSSGVWLPVTTLAGPPVTNGAQVTFTDTNAVTSRKFYRLNISMP